jgi:hypothetical protein
VVAEAPVNVVDVAVEDEPAADGELVVPEAAPLVAPVPLETGATAEDSALAAACDEVDVW